ncbi:uncharacterized protein LOC9635665 isoform X1 [Selaginella moellendorffii]|nr:uncharacterized protein LOC9635665 isoform X1 [Selaginella moellendorffii]|eukprot:XP_002965856.2 uncharacterized protein LOC9635665 isoform X1 [Selaginella moellendorffii]
MRMQVDFDPDYGHTMAQVVYYLSRNGKVDSPHMIDVAFHAPGLRLRDVKFRLTALRGCRMPVMYAWSFKRIYKNTSIWQDVSDDDFVLPVASGEYVLKGSEIVEKQVPKCKQPGEVLQRKYRGAESWLTAIDSTSANTSKPEPNSFLPLAVRRSYEQPACKQKTVLDNGFPEDKLSDGIVDTGVRHSTGSILQESTFNELKVYTIKTPAVIDQGCDATTQTEEQRRKMGQASTATATSFDSRMPGQDTKVPRQQKLAPDEVVLGVDASSSPPGAKKHGKSKRFVPHDKEPEHLRLKTKNGSSSWVFLHVLSYCGGLNTKDQAVNPPLAASKDVSSEYSPDEHSRDLRADGDNLFFSDTSRETQQSTTGDSFNSSDASEEGRVHKVPALVDVKEILKPTSPSRGRGFSLLGRQYGRLSKSGTYCSRNVKYDLSRGNGPLKLELSCYSAE